MKREFNKMMRYIQKHISELCMTFGLIAAICVFISWVIGYWAKGLYNMNFPIESCWQGYTSMGVGLVGLFKWLIDSSPMNSQKGVMPFSEKTQEIISAKKSSQDLNKEVSNK